MIGTKQRVQKSWRVAIQAGTLRRRTVRRWTLRSWTLGLAISCLAVCAALEAQRPDLIKPEWVRAHEEFLASDALAGRGSATRDEQIAAEYVASEFVAFGLKPAPGMTGLIQSADVVAPELDGRSNLSAGAVSLVEGSDLRLLVPTGLSATGPLLRIAGSEARQATIPRGAIVLLTDISPQVSGFRAAYQLRRSGASVVVFTEDDALRSSLAKNPNPRPPLRLNQEPGDATPLPATLAAVSEDAMRRLLDEKAGTTGTLTVHALPAKLRKTFNAIGYLPGEDPAAGTILLSAHLDHLGVVSTPVNGDAIYNGANDDAAGTTAVLELAHALASGPKLRRSILFVCYGSEEAGGLGSQFFSKHPPVPLAQMAANLEFEMVGAQDPKMPKDTLLLTGWERSNLGPVLRDHGAKLGPDPTQSNTSSSVLTTTRSRWKGWWRTLPPDGGRRPRITS